MKNEVRIKQKKKKKREERKKKAIALLAQNLNCLKELKMLATNKTYAINVFRKTLKYYFWLIKMAKKFR